MVMVMEQLMMILNRPSVPCVGLGDFDSSSQTLLSSASLSS